ncbi:MAG TPA: hypothetical protein VGG72_31995 [Bryobacteraceae bacterium]
MASGTIAKQNLAEGLIQEPPTRVVPWIAALLGLTLLLAPSGWFAWKFRSMPQLGAYHDDAVLWLSAQSLAGNHGYRIPQLPENPAQTKYPPIYPLLLSLVWRFAGAFPGNLSALTALQWFFYAPYVSLVWLYFRQSGFNAPFAYALTLIPALCPITIILGVSSLTELPFCVVLLGLMLLLEAKRPLAEMGLWAGILGAVAFLIRTNSIVLVVSVPLVLILQRKIRAAVAFSIPMLAAIAGWQLWCLRNGSAAKDDMVVYYTSYVKFYIQTFSWADFPHRLWTNFASVIEALARLVLFSVDNTFGLRVIGWLLTVTAAAGVVTLVRRGHWHYPAFAALFIVVLVLWQYPPDTRFVYPLFPLYVAGLATKLRDIAALAVTTWREKGAADRVAVVVMVALIGLIAAGAIGSAVNGIAVVLPQYFGGRETQRDEMVPVYNWIASHTGSEDRFSAYDDTMLYLNAGRRGYTIPLLPRLVYGNDPGEVRLYIAGMGTFWSAKRVDYVLVTKYDFRRDLHEDALDSLTAMVKDRSRFQPVYSDETAQVYRFLGNPTP